ncbi:MAG: TolC family protein [Caulobacteraceae bacterium]
MNLRRCLMAATAALTLCVLAHEAVAATGSEAAFVLVLPEEQLARAALEAHPEVMRAKAMLDLSRANGRQLAAGDHEFVVSGAAMDRRIRSEASFPEFSLDLSRAVRLPGKATLDRQAGAMGVKAAIDGVDDARHQTGLRLGDAWLNWIEAHQQLGQARQTEASLQTETGAVQRRVALKDAALLDLEQAQAALAAARSRRAQAEGALEATRLALIGDFPGLALPASPPDLPDPVELDRPLPAWRAVILERSHEIRIADYLSRQADAVAARAKLDRRPDPTIGVRAFSERGGREQGLGVYFSTPIGGARRSALADAETAKASEARIAVLRVRREVEALAQIDIAAVQFSTRAWRSAQDSLEASKAASGRTRRGRELGELDLAAALIAERQAYDAHRAEITARTEAWRALVHLRLDAHDLWADEE